MEHVVFSQIASLRGSQVSARGLFVGPGPEMRLLLRSWSVSVIRPIPCKELLQGGHSLI